MKEPSKKETDENPEAINIEQIMDVEVPVVVRFGKTEMLLGDVTRLAPGSLIGLDRSPDEAVELLVNNRPFAKGEVVVVDGNYALRVQEIVSQDDRIRSLGS